jgi:hypothetical protein
MAEEKMVVMSRSGLVVRGRPGNFHSSNLPVHEELLNRAVYRGDS